MQRTDFVTNREDVITNIKTLYAYAQSEQVEHREWAEARYAQGTWFVVEKIGNLLYFAPSRFVGYKNNTLQKHTNNHGDGTETNRILDGKLKLYKPIRKSEGLLSQFQSFLMSLSFQKKPKKNVKFFIPRNIELSDWDEKWTEDLFYSSSEEYDSYIELLKSNKNLILTGAPGTGKTYMAKAIAEAMNANTCFVQFHPSYDYTDFVEGLRPTPPDANGNIGFERKDGIFKEFCSMALNNFKDSEKTSEDISFEKIFEEKYYKLLDLIQDNGIDKIPLKTQDKYAEISEISDKENILFKGNDGFPSPNCVSLNRLKALAKAYKSKEELERMSNIGKSIRDIIGGCNSTWYWAVLYFVYTQFGDMSQIKNTVHKKIEKKNFVFIIDEINRGEISKIFGELFFSIDPGYRGEKGRVKPQYQNLITDETDPFYDGFYVPENVYIIGTMNDIDRSVESMDFAMRRRFAWKEVKANENIGMLEVLGDDIKDDVCDKMKHLNTEIENIPGLGSAYHIGGAYFCKLALYLNKEQDNTQEAYEQLWENHLKGVLFEYLRGMADADAKLERLKTIYFKEDEDNQSER